MKVAYFSGLRALQLGEAPQPRLVRPDDVLVRIDRVGVCGSDVHYYLHGGIAGQRLQYPAMLGHECSGTIAEVGAAVDQLRPGDRVAIDPAFPCGQCDQCRAGRENTCRNMRFMGCPDEAPGAAAEFHVLPASNCVAIPASMSLEEAVAVEPLSIGLYAVGLADVRSGARIAIFGAGPIGLSVLLCAKATAQCTVYVTDLLDGRLETARRCGADWTGHAQREDIVALVSEREPLGLDVAFECSGDPACIDQGQRLLRPGGTLVLLGIPVASQVSFDIHLMRRMELCFKSVRRQTGCVAPVIRLMSAGRIDARPLLTHCFPLQQIREAFELVAGYRDGVIKAVLDVSGAK